MILVNQLTNFIVRLMSTKTIKQTKPPLVLTALMWREGLRVLATPRALPTQPSGTALRERDQNEQYPGLPGGWFSVGPTTLPYKTNTVTETSQR